MRHRRILLVALVALLSVAISHAAALSDVLGTHAQGAVIAPRANAYRSRRTLMPFNYYQLPVCKPSDEVLKRDKVQENLGEILTGNRLVPTGFSFKVAEDVKCAELCSTEFTRKAVRRANYMIENKYMVRMFLDDAPLVSEKSPEKSPGQYTRGYLLGPVPPPGNGNDKEMAIHNHLHFTIRYSTETDGNIRVRGFKVVPKSIADISQCSATEMQVNGDREMTLPITTSGAARTVRYTYSVHWEDSDEDYPIAHTMQEEVQKRGHKIAAMYSVLLTVLAGVVVAFVMLRTVRKDLAIYLDEELDEAEAREESGWKLVRGDVFRPPPYAVVLATLVGTGCQIVVTVLATMLLCCANVVHPERRGQFLKAIIVVFLLTHAVSGFATARLLKLFGMGSWKTAVACMAAFPLALGCGLFGLNMIYWLMRSTGAIPISTILIMAFVWVAVSLPFGAVGVFGGFSMDTIAVTAKVSTIPRLIPAEAGSKTLYYLLFGSLVPFIACCVDMAFTLNAFWREEQMLMFGLLTFFLCTLALLCAEVGIVVTYFTLRDEDYRWWWRSFGSLAMAGVYVFGYSVFFLLHSLEIRLVSSMLLFLSYMFGVSVMFALALGCIGFLGSLWLVQRMYAAIKAD